MKSSRRKRCFKGKSCGGSCIYRGFVCQVDLGINLKSSLRGVRADVMGAPAGSKDIPVSTKGESISDRAQKLAREIRRKRIKKENYSEDWNRLIKMVNSLQGDEKRDATIKANAAIGKRLKIPVEHKSESKEDAQAAGRRFLEKYKNLGRTMELINRYESLFQSVASRLNNNPTPEQMRQISSRLTDINNRRGRAEKELERIMIDARERLLKTNLTDKQVKDLVSRVWTDGVSGTVKGHMTEFIRMFNGRGFTETQGEGWGKPVLRVSETAGRAHATPAKGLVQTSGKKVTDFHEMAHIVEAQRPWMIQYAVRWRDSRAYDPDTARRSLNLALSPEQFYRIGPNNSVPLFKLNQLFPGAQYAANEVAMADKFFNKYMGKVYHEPGKPWAKQRATEVWSMAFEQFSSPQGMASLYRAHPELFEIVAGLASSS
jgi:hypothetical protein